MSLISIVVPVYNVEHYICKCIDSILNQSFKDFELILVDDGSKDKSGKICNDYASIDRRIKVIHKENEGLSSARNAGLDIASCKYISFIDSDDYVDKDFLKELYNLITINNSDMSMCGVCKFNDNSNPIVKCANVTSFTLTKDEFWDWNTRNGNSSVAWNKLYRRELFINIRYPNKKLHEDIFVLHHLIEKIESITITTKEMYFYRQREISIMSQPNNQKYLDRADAFIDRFVFFLMNRKKESLLCVSLNNCLACLNLFPKELKKEHSFRMQQLKDAFKKHKRQFSKKNRIKYDICFVNPKLYSNISKRIKR